MSWRFPVDARSERVIPGALKGRVERTEFESSCLRDNPWGDPHVRELPVYVPPTGTTEGRPLLVLLSGYTGAGWLHFQRAKFPGEALVHRLDRMIRTGLCPEAVMVAPDSMTCLGGSQYLNSTATGAYEDYVVDEVIPWVREKYRTGRVAVLGTSSGGYGALVLGLRHPRLFRAVASNAGDAYFEYCYLPDFALASREIRRAGGPEPLLRRFLSEPTPGFGPGVPMARAVSMLAYASCYSPRPDAPGQFDLPFDEETGEILPDVWSRWLAWDPVRMIREERYREAALGLEYLYVDGGRRDEFGLDVSARVFASAARRGGVRVDHEEFDGGHFESGPRYEVMIPRILRALGTTPPGAV